ncbi:hypothetical protein [Rhodococcus sp. NPDC127528]|uniref:hypothetical protein n=1 Tax=unclassified Rhodococcus (in: high G+C Gram-positive bacteria) TaxID=192944 RepID=UPI003640E051
MHTPQQAPRRGVSTARSANERTFLGGLGAALVVQATAVAFTEFVDVGHSAVECAVAALAVSLPLIVYRRWVDAERSACSTARPT